MIREILNALLTQDQRKRSVPKWQVFDIGNVSVKVSGMVACTFLRLPDHRRIDIDAGHWPGRGPVFMNRAQNDAGATGNVQYAVLRGHRQSLQRYPCQRGEHGRDLLVFIGRDSFIAELKFFTCHASRIPVSKGFQICNSNAALLFVTGQPDQSVTGDCKKTAWDVGQSLFDAQPVIRKDAAIRPNIKSVILVDGFIISKVVIGITSLNR